MFLVGGPVALTSLEMLRGKDTRSCSWSREVSQMPSRFKLDYESGLLYYLPLGYPLRAITVHELVRTSHSRFSCDPGDLS